MGLRVPRPRTLRGRMVAVTVLVATLLAVALVLLTQAVMARANDTGSRHIAASRAEGLAAALDRRGSRVELPDTASGDVDRAAWAVSPGGRILVGQVPAGLVAAVRRTAAARSDEIVGEQLLHPLAVRVGGLPVVVVSSVDLTTYEDSERNSLWVTIALGVAAVLMAGIASREVARISLGKVHEMAAKADDWQEHDLDHRFGLGPPVDEISELGATLDRMLGRIADALADERRLTDEVAHELRTPLTVVRSEAQLAMAGSSEHTREALERIVTATDAMTAAIRTMLETARARVDTETTDDLVAVLARLDHAIEIHGPTGVGARLSPDTLAAMVRPVLANAHRHARSQVRVEVAAADPVRVTVLDDGPGFTEESAERAFDPGWSGSESSGLGLAVVRRIAVSAGVQVRAVPGPGGTVELLLPPT